jgi:hypothetical protein
MRPLFLCSKGHCDLSIQVSLNISIPHFFHLSAVLINIKHLGLSILNAFTFFKNVLQIQHITSVLVSCAGDINLPHTPFPPARYPPNKKSSTIKSWPTFCDQYFWKFPIWNSHTDEKRREIRMVKVFKCNSIRDKFIARLIEIRSFPLHQRLSDSCLHNANGL